MKVFRKGLLLLFVSLFAVQVHAQSTYEDAVKLYNSAQEKATSKNFDDAISDYKQAADIGGQLGTPQGDDIKTRSEQQIPKVYLNKAGTLFNAFRSSKQIPDLDKAIAVFEETVEIAKEYGDDRVQATAVGYVPQLYFQKAIMQFRREMYTEADQSLDNAIRANSNYAQPYYQKGLVAKKVNPDDIDTIIRWFDQAIAVATTTNTSQVVRTATKAAHDELLFRGSKAIESKQYSNAIGMLEQALNYDAESPDVHYRLAEAHNKRSNFDAAIASANDALKFEQGGKSDKAKIYFELGTAYQAKAQKAQACEAFTNASFGAFKSPAEHIIEFELKCKSTN